MSRTERLFKLIQILRRHRRPVSGGKLAAETGVSLRTLYRDIQTLADQGAPIEGERGIGFLLRPGFLLPPLMFRDDEIEALVLGARWVALRADHDLATAAQDVISKVTAVLPPSLKERIEDAALFPAVEKSSDEKAGEKAKNVRLLRQAMRQEKKIRISYQDKDKKPSVRTVWPLAIGIFESVQILVAWCESRKGFRHFRIDRMASIIILTEALPKRRTLLLQSWRESEGLSDPAF